MISPFGPYWTQFYCSCTIIMMMQVELVQTLEECSMGDFIPLTASEGLREILLGCFDHSPEKRIPASVLLSSPWFRSHEINEVDDAVALMKVYLDRAFPSL